MTLRLRLLLVLVGIVAVGLVVSDVVTYTSLQSFLVARLDQQLQAAPDGVPGASGLRRAHEPVHAQFVPSAGFRSLQLTSQVPSGAYGELRDGDTGQALAWACFQRPGHVASRSPALPSPLPVSSGAQKATIFTVTRTGCGAHAYQGIATFTANVIQGGPDLVVIVAVRLTDVNETLGHLLLVEGLVSGAVLIGLGALSWWMVRRGLRPLDEMATTAGTIASGDLSQRVPDTDPHTEVGRLGVALNTMLTEIEGAFAARAASEERLRRFLADVSHELADTAHLDPRLRRDLRPWRATAPRTGGVPLMRHIRSEANRMSELVDDLLLLARLDRERPLAHEQVEELTAVVAAAVDAAKAPDRACHLRPLRSGRRHRRRQPPPPSRRQPRRQRHQPHPGGDTDRRRPHRRRHHRPDRGRRRTRHRSHRPRPHLRTLPPCSDPSRARSTGGVGLGLAIVSAIASAHGGTVGVDSEPGVGRHLLGPAPPGSGRTSLSPAAHLLRLNRHRPHRHQPHPHRPHRHRLCPSSWRRRRPRRLRSRPWVATRPETGRHRAAGHTGPPYWADGEARLPALGDRRPGRRPARPALAETAPRLLGAAPGFGIDVDDTAAADAPSPMPAPEGEAPHCAQISVWVDSYDRRRPFDEIVAGLGTASAGYLVVESLYEDYGTTPHAPPRSWPDGERSPGVLTVALIHRPDGLAYDDWIDRWHGTQSPLSAELQPCTRYVRNEVVRPLTGDAPHVDGTAEEAWPSARHVADPLLFYNAASADELTANIARMLESVNACLDLTRLRSATMSEYLVKTP